MVNQTQEAPLSQAEVQARLEGLTLADMRHIISRIENTIIRPYDFGENLMQRVETARFTDEVLATNVLPIHLYVVAEIVSDPHVPATFLDTFLSAVRELVMTDPKNAAPGEQPQLDSTSA